MDDAIKKADLQASVDAKLKAEREALLAAQRQEFIDLVGDFLARMSKVANPGTEDWKIRKSRRNPFEERTKVWRLQYERGDRIRYLVLTVDGRVPSARSDSPYADGWVTYRDGDTDVLDWNHVRNEGNLRLLGESMAAVVLRYGAV